jgi:hypothetical protein
MDWQNGRRTVMILTATSFFSATPGARRLEAGLDQLAFNVTQAPPPMAR